MSERKSGGWRYQPVYYTDDSGTTVYGLCEVYFDQRDRLENWTESRHIEPMGESISELTADLARMIVDAMSWLPVPYDALKTGLPLPPIVTMDQRRALADFVDRWNFNMDVASSPAPEDKP